MQLAVLHCGTRKRQKAHSFMEKKAVKKKKRNSNHSSQQLFPRLLCSFDDKSVSLCVVQSFIHPLPPLNGATSKSSYYEQHRQHDNIFLGSNCTSGKTKDKKLTRTKAYMNTSSSRSRWKAITHVCYGARDGDSQWRCI